jgi:hypothetical protein
LPAVFAGDWAGVGVIYDLDRVLDWDTTRPTLLADVLAAFAANAATDPSPERTATELALQHQIAARTCAHLVYAFTGGHVTAPAAGDAAAWGALSRLVLMWIAAPGTQEAWRQAYAPFTSAASPSSGSTASS